MRSHVKQQHVLSKIVSMILHDPDQSLRPLVKDAIMMDSHEEPFSNLVSSPRHFDHTGTPDDSLDSTSDVSGKKTQRSKKRVQFLPDGVLVRIRVIPPRSNKSSSDSDGSASDSSDSDDSDSETITDSEDLSSDRDTPSPAVPTESKNKFATMPPLVYTAKGSYSVSKPSNKNTLLVAKITGINRPASPSQTSGKTKKTKRINSPKPDRGPKKSNKQNDKPDHCKRSPDENKVKGRRKRIPLKFKEGKISPPPPAKSNKTPSTSKTSVKLSHRRGSTTTNVSKTPVTAKRHQPSTTVSTSVKPLSTPASSPSPDVSLDRVSRAMQSLSMGKLYTLDGFIFPPHHANELHLPDLSVTSKSEDFGQSSGTELSSPRRSLQVNNVRQQQPNQSQPSQQQISPTSANRKRRHYAWQMANGSIQSTLSNTPNISQLWDNISVHHSDSLDKTSFNVHKQV